MSQPDTSDFGNMIGSLKPNPTPESVLSETSNVSLSPVALYETIDEWSRTATMFLAEDLGLGMGFAIIGMSFLIKAVFLPLHLKLVRIRSDSASSRCEDEAHRSGNESFSG